MGFRGECVKKKKPFGCLFGLIALIFLLLFLYWQNFSLQIMQYDLAYAKLPDGFDGYRIVQISDMHGMSYGPKNKTLIDKIDKLKPDALMMTGDMISSHARDGQAFLDFLDGMRGKYPMYMSLGNHEQIADWYEKSSPDNYGYDDFISQVLEKGVILLDNNSVEIKRGDDAIRLYGLTSELYHYSRRDAEYADDSLLLTEAYIEGVLKKPTKQFTILLAHNPSYFKEYTAWGADLTLSGHMHGGIIQVPFKGGLLSPERIFFPEYDAGLFEEVSRKMVVNRGLGYSQISFRLFNRPDISLIVLHKE